MAGRRWEKAYEEGIRAARRGDHVAAREGFDRAIRMGADRWQAFYGRAWADVTIDPPSGSAGTEDDLRAAIAHGGGQCPDAAALLGGLRLRAGDAAGAFPLFLQALGGADARLADLAEKGLVDSLSRVLDAMEQGPAEPELDERCEELQTLVRAASLPAALERGLLAEIVATKALCLDHAGDGPRAEQELQQLAILAPDHPRLPADFVRSGGSQAAPVAARDPTFDDIGGQGVPGSIQARLCRLFETYFGDPDLEATRARLEQFGQAPTRTILLFGPSGCGKTYIVRAFAGEYRRRHRRELSIHTLRLNEVMDKYVGESEKALTRVFDQAMQAQPGVIFADEVDAIGGARDQGQDWRAAQTAHLLQELDRLPRQGAFILFFGCTNRIWAMELALLRRFDQMIMMEMPGEDVRAGIFDVQMRRLSPSVRPTDLDVRELARASHGLTPGDIEKAVRLSVDRLLEEGQPAAGERRLSQGQLVKAVAEYRRPMHVRDWYLRSRAALRKAGHHEMAEEIERSYGQYVDVANSAEPAETGWQPIPVEAWAEEQVYDLAYIRRLRP